MTGTILPNSTGPFPAPLLASEQGDLLQRVADLARSRFAPRATGYDTAAAFPAENYQDLRDAGLLGLRVPEASGGCGADPLTYAFCILEIAKACASTALSFNMHSTVLALIAEAGTQVQRQRYFDAVVHEGKLIASVTSEPDSSFRDRFVLQTRFIPVDDGYQVRGLKHFVSIGDRADYYFVSGMLDGIDSAKDGMLTAMIPATNPGISVAGDWDVMGMRGTNSLAMRFDTHIEASDVIGTSLPGEILKADWSGFTLGYAATYLGIGEAAFDYLLEYARTTTSKPSNQPLSQHPLTQRTIGELGKELHMGRLMLAEAAGMKQRGEHETLPLLLNELKIQATEVGLKIPLQAIRIAGGRGITKQLPLERLLRDSVAGLVMPPANDRCLEVIGQSLLFKEPARRALEFK